jgi:hypothetical protein
VGRATRTDEPPPLGDGRSLITLLGLRIRTLLLGSTVAAVALLKIALLVTMLIVLDVRYARGLGGLTVKLG